MFQSKCSCVRQKLEEDLEIDLLGLNSNVHPIDGIAVAARKALNKINTERNNGECYGKTYNAYNSICSLSKLRVKQGTGGPEGFKLFLKKQGIETKIIMRYIGTLLHVLFHLAGVFFTLKEKLIVQEFCNTKTNSKAAILKDLRNPSILLHPKVLGLMGKLVTGPWMTRFYGSITNKTNLEVISEIKDAVKKYEKHLG